MLGDECLQLTDDVGVTSEGKVGFDPLLDDRVPQLLEAADLRLREGLVRDVGEGWSTPEPNSRSKPVGGRGRTSLRERVAPVLEETLTSSSIQLLGRENQRVAGRSAQQTRGSERRAQA
jgi:hypothetical protein